MKPSLFTELVGQMEKEIGSRLTIEMIDKGRSEFHAGQHPEGDSERSLMPPDDIAEQIREMIRTSKASGPSGRYFTKGKPNEERDGGIQSEGVESRHYEEPSGGGE